MSRENLLRAWQKFSRGKWRQRSVQKFWLNLEGNLTALYHDLRNNAYKHGHYYHFVRQDTKSRDIYVASVRDRVVHQVLADYLERMFGPQFIVHSYAAQNDKGVHAARAYVFCILRRLKHRDRAWIAKLDVEKYFANVGHDILLRLLERHIFDQKILDLCTKIIASFGKDGRGMPLGNLTSQWFGNIYLHELDFYAKQKLRVRYYLRYNDDIMVVETNEQLVRKYVQALRLFAQEFLKLNIPETKTAIVKLPEPVDVLGVCTDGKRRWVRPTTEKKAVGHLARRYAEQAPTLLDTMCSYYGSQITYVLQDAFV